MSIKSDKTIPNWKEVKEHVNSKFYSYYQCAPVKLDPSQHYVDINYTDFDESNYDGDAIQTDVIHCLTIWLANTNMNYGASSRSLICSVNVPSIQNTEMNLNIQKSVYFVLDGQNRQINVSNVYYKSEPPYTVRAHFEPGGNYGSTVHTFYLWVELLYFYNI